MPAGIVAIAADLTGAPVSSADFGAIDLTREWIERRSGISSRHWWPEDVELHVPAGRVCNQVMAGASPGRCTLIVVSTSSSQRVPPLAALVASAAGLPTDTLVFDMNSACSGFVAALVTAASLVDAGQSDSCIVCTVEAMSRVTNRADRKSAFLFGDGAAAVLIESREHFSPVISRSGTDGSCADLMRDRGSGIELDGMEVFDHAVTRMQELAQAAAQDTPRPTAIIPHQANGRILTATQRGAGVNIPFIDRIAMMGNTSSASIPLAMYLALCDGEIPPQGRLAALSYGAGETWGSASTNYEVHLAEAATVDQSGAAADRAVPR
ncbi:ketoacyl-ACP synthase III [Luteococcus sediminum]|uniref:3-oxoacyl-ACP synthase III family protein n=1 Tax=Luteococcus sp. TaxID=1969402 RepID=UPI003736C3EE